jgi:hypothetical protein
MRAAPERAGSLQRLLKGDKESPASRSWSGWIKTMSRSKAHSRAPALRSLVVHPSCPSNLDAIRRGHTFDELSCRRLAWLAADFSRSRDLASPRCHRRTLKSVSLPPYVPEPGSQSCQRGWPPQSTCRGGHESVSPETRPAWSRCLMLTDHRSGPMEAKTLATPSFGIK